ncbi:MAG: hypothetical protein ABI562_05520 [Chloroflexota bacterium]
MLDMRIALVAALWTLAGCTSSTGGGSLRPSSSQPSEVSGSGVPDSSGAIDLPGSVLDPVIAEVSRLSGVPADQVTVLSAEAVTFPDGSLGCPLPGMLYTQVMTDGYKVVAEVAGTTYDFRGTGAGQFRRCEKPAG